LSIFQAQDDLSKQLQVMKSMLYGAETSTSSSASSANQVTDQQSDIVLAQLSQVSKELSINDVTWDPFRISLLVGMHFPTVLTPT
jgi:hypothetical protein